MSDELNLGSEQADIAGEILGRIGQLTRALREGMRELGLDKQVALAAEAIPDARDRLNYIATMTERAAERALNAVDIAQPLQEKLALDARSLDARWAQWSASPRALETGDPLVAETHSFLQQVPKQAGEINAQLLEIMMAQDFQDLTGQVIKKMMEVINAVETQLLKVLVDHAPKGLLAELHPSLQNGPQVKPGDSSGVSSQAEADDILASLGF
jgi:chemotaxis protein CheZ